MPLYSYLCSACDKEKDEYRSVSQRNRCPKCDACDKPMVKIITGYAVHGDVDYYDENLEIRVKSKQHRKQLMRERGVTEKYGKGWI